ncbi:hypothetical protein ACSBR2_012641 [Camellia fascicularis]
MEYNENNIQNETEKQIVEFNERHIENETKKQIVEFNEGHIENETEKQIVEFNERHIENDKNKNVEEKIEDPKVGILFDSIDEIVKFYQQYAKGMGFGMLIRSSRKVQEQVRYVTVACSHTGKPRINSSKLHQLQPQSKTVLCNDGKWMLNSVVLDHNHGVSPSKARFYRCHRFLTVAVKSRLELNNVAGIRTNKSFNSLVVEFGVYNLGEMLSLCTITF